MRTVLIYSGGLDSTVLLYDLLAQGDRVFALTVNYGQRHAREIESAATICRDAGVPHEVVDMRSVRSLFGGSSLTDLSVPVPEGHYAENSMKSTVVPNRNMLLLALATAWAITNRAERVAYAAHSGDHTIYPDCRPAFAKAMDQAMRLADWQTVALHRPYVEMTKADLVRHGAELNVPFEQTWSCYQGEALHCGRCGTCIERREAFYLAGIPDPTPYAEDAPTVGALIAADWKLC
jgi:7-cyano-7-deazaguanine synthase